MEKTESQKTKFKSKLPVFKRATDKTTQAPKPKVTFQVKDVSNTLDSRQKAEDFSKTQSTIQKSCRRRLIKTDDTSDILFEPDEEALNSILSNKGVETVVANNSRAMSERIVPSAAPAQLNRMTNVGCMGTVLKTPKTPINYYTYTHPSTTSSLMESYLEHQENLKIYREKMKHIQANLFVADPEAKRSILNGQGISTSESTFRPSIYKDYSCTSTLMESYLEYQENMKIFRRNTQGFFTGCTTPFKPSHEVQLSKSPFRTPAAQNRYASQTSSAMKVPSSILKAPSTNTNSEFKLNCPTGNQVPVDQIKSVSWSSKKVGFSNVVSDYRPTSILKNTLSNRDDSEDSGQDDCKNNNGSAHRQTIHSTSQDKQSVPSSLEFVNCPPKSSDGSQQAPSQVTFHTESQTRTPFKSLVFNNKFGDIKLPMRVPVTPKNENTKPPCRTQITPSKFGDIKLPMRVPVTPKNENTKPPCRAQSTPLKSEMMKLPGRTPVTPKENGYHNLPQRIPVLKSGNRQLYARDSDSAL